MMVGLSSVANSLSGASMMRVSGDCTDEAEVLRKNFGWMGKSMCSDAGIMTGEGVLYVTNVEKICKVDCPGFRFEGVVCQKAFVL